MADLMFKFLPVLLAQIQFLSLHGHILFQSLILEPGFVSQWRLRILQLFHKRGRLRHGGSVCPRKGPIECWSVTDLHKGSPLQVPCPFSSSMSSPSWWSWESNKIEMSIINIFYFLVMVGLYRVKWQGRAPLLIREVHHWFLCQSLQSSGIRMVLFCARITASCPESRRQRHYLWPSVWFWFQVKDIAPDRPLQDEKDEHMVPKFCYILESLGGRLNIPLLFQPTHFN